MSSIISKQFLTDFQTISSKNYAFYTNEQPIKSKTIGINNLKGQFLKITLSEKSLKVSYINGHISKLKLSVCSLQWYQKLILPKLSLVLCFVGVPHIPSSIQFSSNILLKISSISATYWMKNGRRKVCEALQQNREQVTFWVK